MILINNIEKIQKLIQSYKKYGKKITFVPTMGALHEGHLSLVKAAVKEGDVSVVSIFVNPAQFGPNEDYRRYPRPLRRDRKLLEKSGVDILFYPRADKMYPEGYSTYVSEERLSKPLCGKKRPGHFRGVATIVAKLFNIVQPDIAYFGQKDYQQVLIVRKIVEDLNMPVKVKVMPIIRESDGLAMSSRNKYLTPNERKKANIIYETLLKKRFVKKIPGIKLDYFTAADKDTLKPVKKIKKGTLIVAAGWLGKTRLIDNIIV